MVLIAGAEFVSGIRRRLAGDATVQIFADSDSLRALEVIIDRRPKVVALDPAFVVTSRGAALIARLKADSQLAAVDLRVLAEDETGFPVLLGQAVTSVDAMIAKASRPLDRCGTRRAPRYRMKPDTITLVNGVSSRLVNLSVTGAQVLSPVRLQPKQAIRLVLVDGTEESRLRASIAWSSAEFFGNGVTYRAGVEFADANGDMVAGYCFRYGTSPDEAFVSPQTPI